MNRYELINFLIKKHKYKSYLEIGVHNPTRCFDHIEIDNKTGIDPDTRAGATYIKTSDDFFAQEGKNEKYDIIFIDGDHYHDQVIKDISNSLKRLNEKGTIVLHDMLYEDKVSPMNSRGTTCWKAFAALRTRRKDLLLVTVEIDMGVGIIQRLNDFKLKYDHLPERFKIYDKDKLVLNPGIELDSIDKKIKNDEERTRVYCQRALKPGVYPWADHERVHPRWLLNYFEDNYKHLMNSYPIEEFLSLKNIIF